MIKPIALTLVFLATLAIAAAYASAFLPGGTPGWGPWALALGIAVCMPAMMALGAARDGRLGGLALPFGFVFLVLAGGFGAALALPPADALDPTLWLGLPPRAAVILYGVGFLPLFVVPIAYALTFDAQTLRPGDLERIRAHRTRAARAAERTAERGAETPAATGAGR